ncbi:MAG: GNAT family N-acetyltransferase [Saprospiraceae bacterium]|nr:GNAT family N-acetyltransferase [Lewinella sp.]
MIFQTDRILVRYLQSTDVNGFHDLQSNPRVMQYTSGKAGSLEGNLTELHQLIEKYTTPGNTFWVWAMELLENEDFIGTCALILNEANECELGFRIREKYWGRGLGKEVAGPLIHYGFYTLKLDRIYGYVDKENIASMKILERFMTFEKEYYNEHFRCIDRKYACTPGQISFS